MTSYDVILARLLEAKQHHRRWKRRDASSCPLLREEGRSSFRFGTDLWRSVQALPTGTDERPSDQVSSQSIWGQGGTPQDRPQQDGLLQISAPHHCANLTAYQCQLQTWNQLARCTHSANSSNNNINRNTRPEPVPVPVPLQILHSPLESRSAKPMACTTCTSNTSASPGAPPPAPLPPPHPPASLPPSLLRVTLSPLNVFEAPDCRSLATQAWEGRLLLAYTPATDPGTSTKASTRTSTNASTSASTNTSSRIGPSGQQAQASGTGHTEGALLSPQRPSTREGFLGGRGAGGCAGGAGEVGPETQGSPGYTGGGRDALPLARADVVAEEGQGQRERQGQAQCPQWLRDSVAGGAPIPVLLLEDSYPGWVASADALAGLEPATWSAPGAPVPGQAPGAPGPGQLAACREAATLFALEAGTHPNKYLWGGTVGPDFDCSGLVQRAYAASGVWIPRDSYQQEAFAQAVPPRDVQRGDLVFFGPPQRTTHVGIVTLVSGRFIAPPPHQASAGAETETAATRQPLATSQVEVEGEGKGAAPAPPQEPIPLASEGEGEAGRPSNTATAPSTVLSEYHSGGSTVLSEYHSATSTVLSEYCSGGSTVLDFPLVRVVHSSGVQSGHGGIAEDWLCPEVHEGGSAVGGRCYGIFRCFRRVTSPLAPFL